MVGLRQLRDSEEGFVLITCMMIMIVLTIVGIMAMNTTQFELMISGNDKFSKSAFHRADSGVYTAPKVIREADRLGRTMGITTVNIGSGAGGSQKEFYRKVIGYNSTPPLPNISFTQGDGDIFTEIQRAGEEDLEGDNLEFASGYEGTSSRVVAILYRLSSTGTAPGNAVSQVTALYKYIPTRPGGL